MSRAPTHDITAIELLLANSLPRLPVFPLPNCVLLPGGLLPLHIFEPRYRALTKACLAGNGVMGIARLMPGYGSTVQPQPAIYTTVGVGQVVCSEELPDGRYMLLLRGIGRALVHHELALTSDGYRQFSCQQLDNQPAIPSNQERHRHQELITLCDQISPHLADAGQQLCELARTPCPGFAADAVAAAITIDANDRQRMLETASVMARLGLAITALHELLAQIDVSNANLN
ncbi:MAG: LON peptidase substrate-binding domain-containing protein [Kofleriaceae bacterium]|nr:LON peptidase substrate-binding domain-containing protein [Kofleriaceae bacterium]